MAVSATARSPSSSLAMRRTKVLSTPPENATSAEPSSRSEARSCRTLWSLRSTSCSHCAGVSTAGALLCRLALALGLARLGHACGPGGGTRPCALPGRRAGSHPLAGDDLQLVRRDVAHVQQRLENAHGAGLDGLDVRADGHLGGRGRLVRLGDAHEVRNLSGEGLLVPAGRVPLDELLGRAVDVDLEVAADQTAVLLARRLVRADRGHERRDLVAGQEIGDQPEALHPDIPLLLGVGGAAPEVVGEIVLVQDLDRAAHLTEPGSDVVDQGRFPGAGHTGQPEREALVGGHEHSEDWARQISYQRTKTEALRGLVCTRS